MSSERHASKDWAVKIEGPLGAVIGLAILLCLIYAITERGWQFFKLPLVIPAIFALLSFIVSITSGSKHHLGLRLFLGLKAAVITALFGLIILSLLLGVTFSLEELWTYSSAHITSNYKTSLVVGLLTFTIGAIFFLIRTVWRVTYGVSEIIAGVSIASYRAFGTEEWFSSVNLDLYLVVLTAGIYLVVRGLDNISQGLNHSSDPILWTWRWLKSQVYVTDPEKLREMYGEERKE